ncbi:MAG TPA: amino acid permease [Prolixibacteraceae bacterium]|nr:amino acid permease [Prolixibacteraceae bacterium]
MPLDKKFGTAPVFFTAISTILGAILFLRFGFAVGTLGFWGVILIILLGHLVTLPTALAISELATNKRVLGGGEYFIISRSFGLNIGSTIGLALFLSQAISVAFYVIAFTESFQFLFDFIATRFHFQLPRQVISLPVMLGLGYLILKKGAGLGVKALYFIVAILFVSLVLFFLGSTEHAASSGFGLGNAEFRNKGDFFMVFAIVFPAFTGMTAGVGLSGDLRNPSKSIPLGTTLATFIGMLIYFFVVYKLALSAPVEDLQNNQLIMTKIALGGVVIIPLGLAASTFSSALGSILVAPRTLQALAKDESFPLKKINNWLSTEDKGEPKNASLVTAIIALLFVALGNVNAVAAIISMFFMVTYGSLCLISFLNHFGTSPSYRPSFRSKWYLSLLGFLVSVWVMFKIDSLAALIAFGLMVLLYFYLSRIKKERKGLQSIFANAIYQMNRNVQVYLQKSKSQDHFQEWRPSAICISEDTFERTEVFRFLNWISFRYGFGTYMHLIRDYYSTSSFEKSKELTRDIIDRFGHIENHVYIDTLISPSYTSAIAQAIQMPGIAGMENNMVIFEYDKLSGKNLDNIIDNFSLVRSGDFDVCILASTGRHLDFQQGIHVWIKSSDTYNANLMILLSFIILGHPDWKKSTIRIFEICFPNEVPQVRERLDKLVVSGRLPITTRNIEIIEQSEDVSYKKLINKRSERAALTLIGFREETLKHEKEALFEGYEQLGTTLFVNSYNLKDIS